MLLDLPCPISKVSDVDVRFPPGALSSQQPCVFVNVYLVFASSFEQNHDVKISSEVLRVIVIHCSQCVTISLQIFVEKPANTFTIVQNDQQGLVGQIISDGFKGSILFDPSHASCCLDSPRLVISGDSEPTAASGAPYHLHSARERHRRQRRLHSICLSLSVRHYYFCSPTTVHVLSS